MDPFNDDHHNYNPTAAPSFPAPPSAAAADRDPLHQPATATAAGAGMMRAAAATSSVMRFPPPPPPAAPASSSTSSARGPTAGSGDFATGAAAAASATVPANVEFFPRTPLYNDRVVPLSVVALLPLIPAFGSFPVAVTAVVGMAATYIADMLNFRRTTIALLVATLVAIWLGFYLGSFLEVWGSAAPFVVLLNASLLMLLLAAWALIHVRWVVLRFPELAVRCERAVMALLPIAALPSLVSTCAALAGSRHAAFALAAAMCALHRLFYWRRPSSFAIFTAALLEEEDGETAGKRQQRRGDVKTTSIRDVCFVIHRPEAVCFTTLTLLLPMCLHVCFVWPTVSRSMLLANAQSYGRWLLAVNACGLISIPAAYLIWNYQRSLWFLRTGASSAEQQSSSSTAARLAQTLYSAVERHRTKVGVAAYLLGMVFGVSRLMHSRYAYFFSGFPPPFNSVMLLVLGCALPVQFLLSRELYRTTTGAETASSSAAVSEVSSFVLAAALGGGTANNNRAGAAASPSKRTAADVRRLWAVCLMLSLMLAVALTLTLGMPPFFVMTTTMSVAAMWAYLVDRKRNASQYTMFIFTSAIALLWWMFMSFSFIVSDLKVFGEEGIIPVPLLAGSMLWVYIFGAWLIPLSFQKEAKGLLTFVLVFHSQKVLWIERVLYSQHEESTYPIQFVLITSIAGCYAMHRLFKHEVLAAGPASVVLGAYLSKIVVYFSDSVEIDYRFSSGSSASAIVRETLLSYSGWTLVSLMLYTYMRLIPDLKRIKQSKGIAAVDKKDRATLPSLVDDVAAEHHEYLNSAPTGLEQLLAPPLPSKVENRQPPSQKEAAAIINWVKVCAFFVSLSAFVFFGASSPTLMRWFVEDVLRVPAPSRMQLLGAALTAASLLSWYWCGNILLSRIEQVTSPTSSSTSSTSSSSSQETRVVAPSSSAATRTFAGLTLFCFCMTMLDPPVEALFDVLASGTADAPYRETDDGLSTRTANRRLNEQHLLLPDLPFQSPWWSRWVLLIALGFSIFIRVVLSSLPKHDGTGNGGVRAPLLLRVALWSMLGVLIGISVTGTNVIIADWRVYGVMCSYFVLTLLCLDQMHYNKLESTEIGIALFIGALVSFVAAIFLLNQVDIFAVTKHEAYLLDGVFASRAGAIGVLAVVSFAMAAALKCRISGFSLLPHPARIETVDALSQIALVLTSSCALSAVALVLLSMLLGAGSTPLLLMAGGALLLIDDRGWGFGLERGLRRYFIPFLVVSLCLWIKAFQEASHLRSVGGTKANMFPYLVASSLCAPGQLVVGWVLWRGGSLDLQTAKAAAKTARGIVALILLVVDMLVVIFTVSMNLRLIAGLNLIGHITRLSLFEALISRAREQFL